MKSVTELRRDCAEELYLEWQSLNQKQVGDYGVYRAVSATQIGLQPIFSFKRIAHINIYLHREKGNGIMTL